MELARAISRLADCSSPNSLYHGALQHCCWCRWLRTLRRKVNEINLSYGLRSALDQPLGLYILLVFNTFKKPKTGILLEIRDLPWPFRCLFGVVPREANKGQALCLGEAGLVNDMLRLQPPHLSHRDPSDPPLTTLISSLC